MPAMRTLVTLKLLCKLAPKCARANAGHRLGHSIRLSSSASEVQLENGQLRKHFVSCAVPMIAFGFVDNTVMLHAGNFIDLTLGVTFGLSTLAAAACGQVCSDSGGVLFGNYIFDAARRMGLPEAKFTPQQKTLRAVTWTGNAGAAIGVFSGCCMGLVNLFFIDTNAARSEKLFQGGSAELDFSVDVSNEECPSVEFTCVTVEGPNIPGVIASVATALTVAGCKIQTMNGVRADLSVTTGSISNKTGEGMCFTFVIHRNGAQVADDKLDELAKLVLQAAKEPNNINSLTTANEQLRTENSQLQSRLEKLQHRVENSGERKLKRRSTTILTFEDGF
mmetsp:Transcript_4794/g.8251  ORF Transcript_4794/g.8251 Transcript_4794/m.8251 type:complete len:335 (-) Transcript_4794:40-1044(-)